MSHSTLDYLRDARGMAERAARIGAVDASAFTGMLDVRYGAVYCLIVIGEALNNIPAAVASLAPEIPWRAAINMRHLLVHYYWRVDFETVHRVLSRDCPSLIDQLDELIALIHLQAP
ncbi:MAG: DUF86 domain-containing protein [Rhodovulum sp.]|nr:DUF86 domain-containing protein [Rhodovulum sp.]